MRCSGAVPYRLTGGSMKDQAVTVAKGVVIQETMKNPAYQAFQILHVAFVIAPILAGLDKFFMKLTDWSMYLWQPLANLAGGAHRFMAIVGVIEIVAGVLVA